MSAQECRDLASATKTLPAMTSGIPFVNSRTLFLIQVAAISLEASASSALSNTLMLMSTSGPPSSKKYSLNPGRSRNSGTKLSCTRRATSSTEPRISVNFLIIVNMFLPPAQRQRDNMHGHLGSQQRDTGGALLHRMPFTPLPAKRLLIGG